MEDEVDNKIDSITIGSASKGGCVKIYHNFADPEGFKAKIDNAKLIKAYANENEL